MSNMNNTIGYVICESAITQNLQPVKIIEETEIDSIGPSGEPIKKKRLIGEGVLQTADLENRNHRIYEEKELFPAIKAERLQTLISHGMLLGEMTHPLDATLARQQTIDEKLSSVRYLRIWTEGKNVWGRYKGTYTQYGQTFDDNLRDGYIPEFSLRALGAVQEAAGKVYVKNLKVITYDNVIYQSDFNAYHRRLVSESVNSGHIVERPTSVDPDIFEPIYNQQVIDYYRIC